MPQHANCYREQNSTKKQKNNYTNTKKDMKKINIVEVVLKAIVAAITAALTAITTTSCMGFGPI